MLTCTTCSVEKFEEEFAARKARKRGRASSCKVCMNIRQKQDRINNPEKWLLRGREYYKNNSEKRVQTTLNSRNKHRERFDAYQKQWKTNNSDKVKCWDKLKFYKRLNRVPPWLTSEQKEQIKYYYDLRDEVAQLTGDQYNVDHQVPLQGKCVSGLHVPWNLQVLPADINNVKQNKFEYWWQSQNNEPQ